MCHSHSKLRKGFQGGYIFSKIHIFTWLFPLPSSGQLLSCVRLFETPWTAACQASLSITNSRSLLKLMSIKSVMPSNHVILCHPLLLLPSIFPSIRVFSSESVLCIRWPKYWSFSFSISPSNEYPGLISFRIDGFDLLAVQGTLESSPAPQFEREGCSVMSDSLRPHGLQHTRPSPTPRVYSNSCPSSQ